MIDKEALAATFRNLSDQELRRRLSAGTLTEIATEIALDELQSRGLSFDEHPNSTPDVLVAIPKATGLETIARFSDPLEAHILKGLLGAEGIPAFVADEHLIRANWFWSNALGGVRVQVERQSVAEAIAIATAMAAGEYAVDTREEESNQDLPEKCPRCSHGSVASSTASRTRALAAFFFLGLPLLFSKNRYRCGHCRYVWTHKSFVGGEAAPTAPFD